MFKLWHLALFAGLISGSVATAAFTPILGVVFVLFVPAMIFVAGRDIERANASRAHGSGRAAPVVRLRASAPHPPQNLAGRGVERAAANSSRRAASALDQAVR